MKTTTRWSLRVAVAATLATAIGVAVWRTPTLRHQVLLSTTRQVTPYTELYFASPAEAANPGLARVQGVPFVVANRTGRAHRYDVSVGIAGEFGATQVEHRPVELADGGQVVDLPSFVPPAGPYAVTVTVDGTESIHLFVP
jgi:hypothetical protein